MTYLKKYTKRILKQYGSNIKAFENRELDPCEEVGQLWDRIHKETLKNNIRNRKKFILGRDTARLQFKPTGVNLADQMPMQSVLIRRWGFASREDNLISCYEDIVNIAGEVETQ